MRYFWVVDQKNLNNFCMIWAPGLENLADYFTKHHGASHHKKVYPYCIRNPLMPLKSTILDQPLCPTTKTVFSSSDMWWSVIECLIDGTFFITVHRLIMYTPSDLQPLNRILDGTLCPSTKTLVSSIDIRRYGSFLSQRIDHSYPINQSFTSHHIRSTIYITQGILIQSYQIISLCECLSECYYCYYANWLYIPPSF